MHAVATHHVECFKELIAAGAEINKSEDDGRALIIAANDGHIEYLQEFIAAGGEINKNIFGTSALHGVCIEGNAECLGELLRNGADMEITDDSGHTPLLSIIISGNHQSMQQGHINCVKQLIDAGANVNFQNQPTQLTSLFAAVSIGHADIVKILISAGADLNKKCTNGQTALICSAVNQNAELTKILIEAGADMNICSDEGFSCIGICSSY